ncbi:CDP-diacylglycerol--glycerol-3-phosphate 3-phosphatidyltransferase [Candidatus Acetothermia bacterium]|nr:CDP-diacylglycerol--glycerol-3-phosphate 3-phosphatidyltransferase [Candidatus Acetothermia bacterium]
MKSSNIFNLPNQITLWRIAMIPTLMFFLLTPWAYGKHVALIIFILAAISDAVDGYIARSTDRVTDFGQFADPIADKLLITAALLPFVQSGKLWSVWVMVILAREFLVTGLRILALAKGEVIKVSALGKWKTFSHIALVVVLIGQDLFDWGPWGWLMKQLFIALAVVLAIASALDYFYKSRHVLRQL